MPGCWAVIAGIHVHIAIRWAARADHHMVRNRLYCAGGASFFRFLCFLFSPASSVIGKMASFSLSLSLPYLEGVHIALHGVIGYMDTRYGVLGYYFFFPSSFLFEGARRHLLHDADAAHDMLLCVWEGKILWGGG